MSTPLLRQNLDEFRQVWHTRYDLLRKWKSEGRTIFGYCYCDIPLEIMHAAGILPIQFTESEDQRHHRLGESISTSYFCDYSQSIIGQALEGIYAPLNGVIFAYSCETMRMLASMWELQVPIDFFYFMPTTIKRNDINRTFLTAEYRALLKALEHFVNHKITQDSLKASIEVYNMNRNLVHKLYQLRFERRVDLSEAELNTVVKAGLVMPVETHNDMLKGLSADINEASSLREIPKVRLMISGFSPEHYSTTRLNIANIIEKDLGAHVVADDFANGHRYCWLPTRTDTDPITALVDRYLGNIPISFRQTCDQEVRRLLTLAKSQAAQGMIIFVPKYCTDFLFQLPYIESEFKRNSIAVLSIETQEEMPEGQLRTRLGGFIEMLERSI